PCASFRVLLADPRTAARRALPIRALMERLRDPGHRAAPSIAWTFTSLERCPCGAAPVNVHRFGRGARGGVDMDRILATHTGSLIRPPELLAFLAAKEHGQAIDEDAYQRTLRDAVLDVVGRQVEAGID